MDQTWADIQVAADGAAMERMTRRMANEIVERHSGTDGVALVGIRRGGYYVAERLQKAITALEGEVTFGAVDITLYRDDVFEGLPKPQVGATELPFDLAAYRIILVDDVLYTGRTVRAALDAVVDFGRPQSIELAVLVDRGHRELPIQPDYVGMKIDTARTQSVAVEMSESEGIDQVLVRSKAAQ